MSEAEKFWSDPINASEDLQINYIWCKFSEYVQPQSDEGKLWENEYEVYENILNPFTNKFVRVRKILSKTEEEISSDKNNFIKKRIAEIQYIVAIWTATQEEKEELRLLSL